MGNLYVAKRWRCITTKCLCFVNASSMYSFTQFYFFFHSPSTPRVHRMCTTNSKSHSQRHNISIGKWKNNRLYKWLLLQFEFVCIHNIHLFIFSLRISYRWVFLFQKLFAKISFIDFLWISIATEIWSI